MSEEDETAPAEDPEIRQIDWRRVPSLVGETILGHAIAGGLHRFVIAEVVFNPLPDADAPMFRPNLNLVVPHNALLGIIANLQGAYDRIQTQIDAENAALERAKEVAARPAGPDAK